MTRKVRLPPPVAAIYRAVEELEALYPGRRLTPDGHLVGSIGEVVAAEALGQGSSPCAPTSKIKKLIEGLPTCGDAGYHVAPIARTSPPSVNQAATPNHPAWEVDTRTPTRLGEETTTLRLARFENGRLVPWCPDPRAKSYRGEDRVFLAAPLVRDLVTRR